MKSERKTLERLAVFSKLTLSEQSEKEIWRKIESGMKHGDPATSTRPSAWRSHLGGIAAAVVAVLLVTSGLYGWLHHAFSSDTAASGQRPGLIPGTSQDFSISYTPEPGLPVPSWLDHGHGMVVRVKIDSWVSPKSGTDGIYLIPTSTNPQQRLSIYQFAGKGQQQIAATQPKGISNGFQFGGGPANFTSAINQQLRSLGLAQLATNEMTTVFFHGNIHNGSVYLMIGNSSTAPLKPSQVRFAVVDVSGQNRFGLKWIRIFEPDRTASAP